MRQHSKVTKHKAKKNVLKNLYKKNIDSKTPNDPNTVKVCIGGSCYLLKKDDKGNFNWPNATLPPPL